MGDAAGVGEGIDAAAAVAASRSFSRASAGDGFGVVIGLLASASALGAALAGGLGTGVWKSTGEIEKLYKSRETKKPRMDSTTRNTLYSGWKKAVKQLLK